jgi:hypothetical protein
MNIEVAKAHRTYVVPEFGNTEGPIDPELQRRVKRPVVLGGIVIGVMVFGLGLWAAFTPIAAGISAPGQIRVEANRKALRYREGGVIKEILIREGQFVRAGQPLLRFSDSQAKAAVDVNQAAYDSLLAQAALYSAESTRKRVLILPPELLARMADPRIAALVRDQQFLFTSRLQLFESQMSVLSQRQDQLVTRIEGLQVQVDSLDTQTRLTQEELDGYRTLYEKGYAPKTLILRYDRSMADLAGRKGALISDIARTREQMGETQMQMNATREQRESQAAEGLRQVQSKLDDIGPRLSIAKETLTGTTVKAPVDGYVLGLSQFTIGGVAAPGELLMDIVPSNAPMVVTVMVKPQDIDEVKVGMTSRVRLSGLNQRWVSPVAATVINVSADAITNDKSGQSFFRADLRVDAKELAKLGHGIKLAPGMPAEAIIVTGKRTVMSYLIQPITDTMQDAMREQ